MTNQFNYDVTLQATDIAYQHEQLSNEELKGVVGGWGDLFGAVTQVANHCVAAPLAGAMAYSLTGTVPNNGTMGMTLGAMFAEKVDR